MCSRQKMMDDGLVYFIDQMRAAILALDPTALVTVGFFVPQGPNPTRPGDNRVIEVYPAMASSTADFVDLHPYPVVQGLTMDQFVQNFGFAGYQQQKPILMGEFGAFQWAYPQLPTRPQDFATRRFSLAPTTSKGGCFGHGTRMNSRNYGMLCPKAA